MYYADIGRSKTALILSYVKLVVLQSTVCDKIVEALERSGTGKNVRQHVEVISQECFYKELSDEQRQLALIGKLNFDHPGIIFAQPVAM